MSNESVKGFMTSLPKFGKTMYKEHVGDYLRAIASACGKDFVYFTLKTYFFYFTPSLLQNIHISLSILQDILIKYSFFSIFLLFLSTTLYIRALSLYPFFWFVALSLSIPISIPISEHRSPLPLGVIHIPSRSDLHRQLHRHLKPLTFSCSFSSTLIENKYQTPSLQNQQDPYSLLKQDPISTPSRLSTDQARPTSTDQTRPTSTDHSTSTYQAPIVP